MNLPLMLMLFVAIDTAALEFDSYQKMSAAGFYYSPGYDCQAKFGSGQMIFTATIDENNFAIFSQVRVPIAESATGYRVTRISRIWASGQHLNCKTFNPSGSDSQIGVFDWTFDTDPDGGPDHLSFVAALNEDGRARIVSCEWSFAEPEVLLTDHGLVARYMLENGDGRDVFLADMDPQC